MPTKELQIVSFDNPYPPNYGGAIDVFYKIKALSELGVKIHLHIYYDERDNVEVLNNICKTVTCYKRNRSLRKHFSLLPYRVNSRFSKDLVNNLRKVDAPILFESLVSTSVLNRYNFKQKIAVRCHNIEHHYNYGIAKSSFYLTKKLAFTIEAIKFKCYQNILNKADVVFSLSNFETDYFKQKIKTEVKFLKVFQPNQQIKCNNVTEDFALFHGDISTSDNLRSALFMIDVFKDSGIKLIIASSHKNSHLEKEISKYSNIHFNDILHDNDLEDLIGKAKVNVMFSFQKSGTKLKVFNALFNGKFCIVNRNMIDDQSILDCCLLAEDKIGYLKQLEYVFQTKYLPSLNRVNALKKYDSSMLAIELCRDLLD